MRLEAHGPRRRAAGGRIFAIAAVAAILLVLPLTYALAQGQRSVALRVDGEVPNQLELGAADLSAFPRRTASVTDESGVKTVYEGVAIIELLRRAGAPLGKDLKGPNMVLCVVAHAFDGYRVTFALADLDPGIGNVEVIVADRRDGKRLDPHEGPLRLIVPGDKRHARWVKGLTGISIEKVR